ncbi:S8 family peptidase [Intrasporangium sp.]|uniref:S8 family peptidase n=1 Tax=Intrasporangium sp. TaxID=1925024 RepID=UPI002939FAB3|nr:S8 family peptidase [Intrasporangium sp.]MDV3221822.1 S8 family peptidase [Intrasporangium sp.]
MNHTVWRRRASRAATAAVAASIALAFHALPATGVSSGLSSGVVSGVSTGAAATASADPIVGANSPDAIEGEYVVVFKNQGQSIAANNRSATAMAAKHGGRVKHTYGAVIDGYAATMTEAQALAVAADPAVERVEQAYRVEIADEQVNPGSWGLDRVDQQDLPLNQRYRYPSTAGSGVHVYVMDTGVNLNHTEFTGRTGGGIDYVDDDSNPSDCNGHGTHVAGTAAGTNYGLAKRATVHAVRVLSCSGSGSNTDIIAGINWIKSNAIKPAVVNYSIGCSSRCSDTTMDNAVKSLVASGVMWVQAGGNGNDDTCYYSPQRVPEALTVGNSTSSDAKASSSAWGSCQDLFAPGTSITSAWYDSNTATRTISGTSMASPHVAGAVALYLGANPGASSAQVHSAIVGNSVSNTLTGVPSGTPNRLLNTEFLLGGTQPGELRVTNPGSQTSTVGTAVNVSTGATGGSTPYTFSATGLPAGLSISSSTGTITGTPSTAGTSSVTVTVRDSSGATASASFSWTVNGGGGSQCAGMRSVRTGTLSNGQTQTLPYFYDSTSGQIRVCLDGPSGADFDVYLQKYSGYSWYTVARGISSGADESFTYSNTTGYYRIVVDSYYGSGSYTVGVDY